MTWFKVDDGFHSHPKVLACDPAAIGTWVVLGSWCGANLTDGHVPTYVIPRLAPDGAAHAEELVRVGLWERADSGFVFHDWLDYNFSAEQVRSERKANADRQKRWRDARRNGVTHAATNDDVTAPVTGAPYPSRTRTRPEATDVASEPLAPAEPTRDDVEQLCQRLHERVTANGAKAAITKQWRDSARLLLDRDGRDLDKTLRLIDWATSDAFWASNILSMPTFRKQYDRLAMQANRQWQERQGQQFGGRDQKTAEWMEIKRQLQEAEEQPQRPQLEVVA